MTTFATLLAGVAAIAAPILALLSRAWSGEFSARKLHRLQRLATLRGTLAEQGQATGVLDRRIAEELRRIQTETNLDRDEDLRHELWLDMPAWKRVLSGLLLGIGAIIVLLGIGLLVDGLIRITTGAGTTADGSLIAPGVIWVAFGLTLIVPTRRWRRRSLVRRLRENGMNTADGRAMD
ncbi:MULTISPECIES: hypothetical protein [unclassified Isoptericola]|uniref:hypothetical protein n=1 Tax=unclassified Isoptericola TaxID=2623355 RepID=UPI0027141EB8|nr:MULTISPECIES: hypothetical protein [unclassified Isoptericola]MDO8144375.1 hypothetical protein [Isoptericola sp. 178]MDO8151706.1 hypothetical protein [Isoptericola sp. b408]